MKVLDKAALLSVALVVVTMPVSGQYVLEGLEWAFQQIFMRGTFVTLAGAVYLIVYIFVKMYQTRDKLNIPEKPKKVTKIPVAMG